MGVIQTTHCEWLGLQTVWLAGLFKQLILFSVNFINSRFTLNNSNISSENQKYLQHSVLAAGFCFPRLRKIVQALMKKWTMRNDVFQTQIFHLCWPQMFQQLKKKNTNLTGTSENISIQFEKCLKPNHDVLLLCENYCFAVLCTFLHF